MRRSRRKRKEEKRDEEAAAATDADGASAGAKEPAAPKDSIAVAVDTVGAVQRTPARFWPGGAAPPTGVIWAMPRSASGPASPLPPPGQEAVLRL